MEIKLTHDTLENRYEIDETRGCRIPHIMIIKPEQSLMIPLNACGFEQVQMRPFLNGSQKGD